MSRSTKERNIPQGSTRKIKKGRAALVVAMLLFFVTGITYALLGSPSTSTLVRTFFSKDKINVLVLGVDTRDDDVGRSDTTFVVTIDTIGKKFSMLSIPRDSRVKIDGHGWDKINHAYAFGGSKLSKSSVENLLGIPIDYTMIINIQNFVRIIDALGGVTIDVEKRMYYSDPYDDDGGLYIDLQPGVQKLNGHSAIQYVRYRDEEGDIGRVSRQQKFLKAVFHEFTKPQLVTKLPDLISELSSTVKTDMPTKEMLALVPIINTAASLGLQTESVTGTPRMIDDISYWLPNIKELRDKVASIQGIALDNRYNQATQKLENEYAGSIPQETRASSSSSRESSSSAESDTKTRDSTKASPPSPSAPVAPTSTESNKSKTEATASKDKILSEQQGAKNGTTPTKETSTTTGVTPKPPVPDKDKTVKQ